MRRRDFLKVVGVSGAGAGIVGCSTQEAEKLLPYVVPPEDITPGVATWYATVCQECPAGCGMWVRTREGRAVKLEGNPSHPVSRGALCTRGHASLQGLYDPDRFTGPKVREDGGLRDASWDQAEALLAQRIQAAQGRVLFVSGRTGPTLGDLVDGFVSAVGGTRVEHEGLSEAPLREATRIAFGANVVPRFDFSAARFVVSFGADFLETWLSPVEFSRGFARMSAAGEGGEKGRLVFVGPRLSLTGQNADEWVPIRAGSEAAVALAMAGLIAREGGDAGPYAPVLEEYDPRTAAEAAGVEAGVIEALAERFVAEGPSLAVGPGVAGQHRNATAANLAVHVLNAVAGNVGRTVFVQSASLSAASRPYGEMESAIRSMAAGGVGVALVHGTNPVYSLPAASGFADAFRGVPFKVSFARSMDETAALADLVLPDRHFLEAWGDSNPRSGVYAIQQPVMRPVPHFDTKQTGDVLASVAARLGGDLGSATAFEHLRRRWQEIQAAGGRVPASGSAQEAEPASGSAQAAGGAAAGSPQAAAGAAAGDDFDAFWRAALRRGVVEVPVPAVEGGEAVTLRSPDTALAFDPPALDGEGLDFTLLVYPSSRFGDGGTNGNRPWLLELPDPVSKLAWHSWVEVHPDAAERLGVRDGDVVQVSSPHGQLELPVWVYPGIREDVVAISMGMGHEAAGRYADGHGVNPMRLLPAVAEQPSGALVHLATRVSVEPTGVRHRLATISGSDTQHGRPIAVAVALDALVGGGEPTVTEGEEVHEELGRTEPEGAQEEGAHGPRKELQLGGGFVPVTTEGDPEAYPLPGSRYGGYADWETTPRWSMAIDLDKCTGCSACVVACQAENNVPWVGQDQVTMGRELHWIRLERYYEQVDAHHAGPLDIRHLPMLCQHCGNAPCEPVCPVFAAYHTPDGINGQVYNRCVGTRYCANNCPYKVRVFNWYTYTDVPEPLNWQYNPDVTVRQNGVMEKCSFCVQRVREAQNRARLEDRPLVDGEIVPACQQTCPAEAIVFGNIRDPASRVAQVVRNERTYRVLDDLLNTQPGVSYLKKVTFHAVESGEH